MEIIKVSDCEDLKNVRVMYIGKYNNLYTTMRKRVGLLEIQVNEESLKIAVINDNKEYFTFEDLTSLVNIGDEIDIMNGKLIKIRRIVYPAE